MGPIGEEGVEGEDDEGANVPFGNMAGGGGEEWMDWQAMKEQFGQEADDTSGTLHDEL
jgi:hypothetical protein